MLGKLLKKIREDNNLKVTALAKNSNFDHGFITRIENNERFPSQPALKRLCTSLNVPFQQIMYAYDKEITPEQLSDNQLNLIPYHSVIAINSLDELIMCPAIYGSASFAVKFPDDSMEPKFLEGTYAFIEQNTPISPKDVALFYYNGDFFIRRYNSSRSYYYLKPDNKKYKTLKIVKNTADNFYVIGKVIGSNDDF